MVGPDTPPPPGESEDAGVDGAVGIAAAVPLGPGEHAAIATVARRAQAAKVLMVGSSSEILIVRHHRTGASDFT
jgi:hypothetical protein